MPSKFPATKTTSLALTRSYSHEDEGKEKQVSPYTILVRHKTGCRVVLPMA